MCTFLSDDCSQQHIQPPPHPLLSSRYYLPAYVQQHEERLQYPLPSLIGQKIKLLRSPNKLICGLLKLHYQKDGSSESKSI